MPKVIKKKKLSSLKSPMSDVIAAMGIEDPAGDEERLSEYVSQNASAFVDEWVKDNQVEDDNEYNYKLERWAEDTLRWKIEDAINDNVSSSMWDRQKHAVADSIERSGQRANVDISVSVSDKGEVVITFAIKDMMRAWAEETEGVGLVAWDPSLKHSDINDAAMLVRILKNRDEVYGDGRAMERTYQGHFDRFEPDTGTHRELSAIAEKTRMPEDG